VGVTAAVVLLVVVIGAFEPRFLTATNLLGVAEGSVYIGLMACGMVFALAMREVDLSVGGNYALCVVTGAVLVRAGLNPWLAVVAVLALATAVGVVNGLVSTYLGLPSFIVTLATALLCRGVGLALADGKQITDLPAGHPFFVVVGGDALGVPVAVWVLVVVAAGLAVVLGRTRFGVRVRAIGSNPDAAGFSGLPVAAVRVAAMGVCGLTAGLAAVLSLAFYAAGDPTIGNGYELTAIAACIIGGTPLAGGRGSVPGAVIGNLILTTVASSLVFFEVPINWTTFATGAVILLAVAVDSLLRRTRGHGVLPRFLSRRSTRDPSRQPRAET
jgi:ribose transport system permease protein